MAIKRNVLNDIIDTYKNDLIAGKEPWIPFLNSASYMYKYQFENQLAIYIQRDDATACAAMPQWNRLGRKIIKERGGIRLAMQDRFSDNIYVWDISDTEPSGEGRDIKLWQLENRYIGRIKEYIEETYGVLGDGAELSVQIEKAVKEATSDSFMQLSEKIFAEADEESLATLFSDMSNLSEIAEKSAVYIVSKRCGFEPKNTEAEFPFSKLSEGAAEYIEMTGGLIWEVCYDMLCGIEKEVKECRQREAAMAYNIDKEEKRRIENERENSDEESRGNDITGYRAEDAAERASWEISDEEKRISDGGKTDVIHSAFQGGEAQGTSSEHSERGTTDERGSDREDDEAGEADRADENREFEFVDIENEGDTDESRDDYPARTDIQLNFFQTEENAGDDKRSENTESEDDAAFIQNEILPKILRCSLSYGSWIEEIKESFESLKYYDRIEYIKNKYTSTFCGIKIDKGEFIAKDDENGITIAKGRYFGEDSEYAFSWETLEETIRDMVNNDKFYLDESTEQFILSEDVWNAFLRGSTYGFANRIKEFYSENESISSRAAFLKDEFGIGGYLGGNSAKVNWDAKGISFEKRNCKKVVYSWSFAGKIVEGLIKKGAYDEIENDGSSKIRSEQDLINEPIVTNAEVKMQTEKAQEERGAFEDDKKTEGLQIKVRGEWTEFSSSKEAEAASYEEYKEEIIRNAENFHIKDDGLGTGTKSEKFKRNVAAIRLLKELERENMQATREQQEILSRYVGWGGLSESFEDGRTQQLELKNLLTEEEYRSAQESVLNAHFTSPVIVRKMYEILDNLDFKGGNILEPAMGIGNFFGVMPKNMQEESSLYGIELDSISARIASQLYPKADIKNMGFEETDIADNSMDIVIGNVPFGQYSVNDKAYNSRGFKIHDYFFAKSLDKVKPGGIVMFITSRYTMDKKSSKVREYIAQRADLLGAIRLPNTAFKANAGAVVTSDILVLQKKEAAEAVDENLTWLNLAKDENGLEYNRYFVENPEMVLGKLELVNSAYGKRLTCQARGDLEEEFTKAIRNIKGKVNTIEFFDEAESDIKIPAAENTPDYSYSIIDGKLYYREGNTMQLSDMTDTAIARAKGMIAVRDALKAVINLQTEDKSDVELKEAQGILRNEYNSFSEKFGYINSRANSLAFRDDASYPLLSSLEVTDDEGNVIRLADIFNKRTVRKAVAVSSCANAKEAYAISLDQCGSIDIDYMTKLSGMDKESLIKELESEDIIFRLPNIEEPEEETYVSADEYLSGNVRNKLSVAKLMAKSDPAFERNVEHLENVLPKWIDASKIDARLGSIWIPSDVYEDFAKELLEIPSYAARDFHIIYNEVTGVWNIPNKRISAWQATITNTYGTNRANAYRIIENSLNLKTVQITDTSIDADGKKRVTVNQEETAKACQKQDLIKEKFRSWIWQDAERRKRLEEIYNVRFNSNVARQYDGSHLTYPGMNPEITLRPHQNRAVARQLYGGNTLLAHAVGAGKTYEMIAAIMEKKRLGLCTKAMLVVPNHLTGQWAKEFMTLYPTANILAVTKKDFTPVNRKKFCSRIATGEYDAVIIGHSQFEMIPLSLKRQRQFLQEQLDDILFEMQEQKAANGQSVTVKQLQLMEKNLRNKLGKLMEAGRKDDNNVTFEELGIDHLAVDEAHEYKNLALVTKMNNVAGISASGANKSYDMFAKCRYIDEITYGRGITFATGTPVSNSMTELYTMQRYLQYDTLNSLKLITFDAWASTFGETITNWELAPEGMKYRQRTRFARFFNLPELMSYFKDVADIETGENLKLNLPKAVRENIILKPTMRQLELMRELGKRADEIHEGNIDPSIDNMLKITTDGRRLALDERLVTGEKEHPLGETKIDALAKNALRIYNETSSERSAQLIFCDQSTPSAGEEFSVYNEVKNALIDGGVNEAEIAFIHSANTEAQKEELFSKVRSGQVRFLMGSTKKMGAGMNVQTRLIALHHLDVPWRPADIEQQEGRIIRQGNQNDTVYIYRYVTENSFDAYSWQTLETKQRFISQIMNGNTALRACEDIDETSMDFAEIKAICTGNPLIKEKMELENDIKQLKLMEETYLSDKFRYEDMLYHKLPAKFKDASEKSEIIEKDIKTLKGEIEKPFEVKIGDMNIKDEKTAGELIYDLSVKHKTASDYIKIGTYKGFDIETCYYDGRYRLRLCGEGKYNFERGAEPHRIVERLDKVLSGFEEKAVECKRDAKAAADEMDRIKLEIEKPFAKAEELREKTERLKELDEILLKEDDEKSKENEQDVSIPNENEFYADNASFSKDESKFAETKCEYEIE